MNADAVLRMPFARVYSLLVAKAERKGRTKAEVDAAIAWLTGYSQAQLDALAASDAEYGAFFRDAPAMNPARLRVTGTVCGVRVEAIEDARMRDVRILDKLVDELAKGRPLEKVLRA